MSVLRLDSDKHFILAEGGSPNIQVYEHDGGQYSFGIIHVSSSRWRLVTTVGRSAQWKGLELYGVRIEGDRLDSLVNDLTMINDPTNGWKVAVNREGLCLRFVEMHKIDLRKINVRFGWSKYGVNVPNGFEEKSEGTKKGCPMCEQWRKLTEEKKKVMEEKEKMREELVTIKAALRTMAE